MEYKIDTHNNFINIYSYIDTKNYILAYRLYDVINNTIENKKIKENEKDFFTSNILYFSEEYTSSLKYANKVFETASSDETRDNAAFLIIANYIKLNKFDNILNFCHNNQNLKFSYFLKLYLKHLLLSSRGFMDALIDLENKDTDRIQDILDGDREVKLNETKLNIFNELIFNISNSDNKTINCEFEYQIFWEFFRSYFDRIIICINAVEDYIKYKNIDSEELYNLTKTIINENKFYLLQFDVENLKLLQEFDKITEKEIKTLKENIIEMIYKVFDVENTKDSYRVCIFICNVLSDLNMIDELKKFLADKLELLFDKNSSEIYEDNLINLVKYVKNKNEIPIVRNFIEKYENKYSIEETLENLSNELFNELRDRIYNDLSIESKLSYKEAEMLYNDIVVKNKNNLYINYAMISLSYYRILEYEINQRIIVPIFKYLDNTINNLEFNIDKSWYWKDYLGKENIKKISEKGLMLYDQYRFFKLLSESTGEAKKISDYIMNYLKIIINDEGLDAIKNNRVFYEVTLPSNVRKYRNPPAHSKFLSREIAIECRNFFIRNIVLIYSYLNN